MANGEAPQLAEMVKRGDLPPLRKRLPDPHLRVKPLDRTGSYGQTWNGASSNPDGAWNYQYIGDAGLVRWNNDWTGVDPNIARSWKIKRGGRELEFHLWPGIKYSDGSPFTADDVVFAYNDVLRNRRLFPAFPDWLTRAGEPGAVTKIDDYSFKFTFKTPNGLLLRNLASPDAAILTTVPFKYFKQFHKHYNPGADNLAENKGYPDWQKLFTAMGGLGAIDLSWWQNPEIPTLFAWRITKPLTGGGRQRLVMKRNPYYWKTDTAGNQLPYLDSFELEMINSPEIAILKASHGEFSLLQDEFMTPDAKPVLARNRKSSGYHFIEMTLSSMNNAIVMFNLNHENDALREVFQNKDFRIGMSYAVDRKTLINAVLQRQGEPWQSAPRPESQFRNKRLAKQYTEYSTEKANGHLDRAGYGGRDSDGFRLGPDGKRIAFALSVRSDSIATWVDTAQLIKKYWNAVGVDADVFAAQGELVLKRVGANHYDAIMDDGYPGLTAVTLNPAWYFPLNDGCQYATKWGEWYQSGGKSGEEPPEAARQQMKLYDELKATPDADRQRELFDEILKIAQEEFYVIGTVLPAKNYSVLMDDFQNVPQSMMASGGTVPTPGWTMPEQYCRVS